MKVWLFIIGFFFVVGALTDNFLMLGAGQGLLWIVLIVGFIGFIRQKMTETSTSAKLDDEKSTLWKKLLRDTSNLKIVKGVYEWIELRESRLAAVDWRFKKSDLIAYRIAISTDTMSLGKHRCVYWKELKELDEDDFELDTEIPIDQIQSVELTNLADYSGRAWERRWQGYETIKTTLKRHPNMVYAGHQTSGVLDWRSVWVVYAFTFDGERIILTQCFDRNFAVKVHTQINNILSDTNLAVRDSSVPAPTEYL